MSISMNEILKGADLNKQPNATQINLNILLERINKVRALWAKPMTVTSGLRSWEDHTRIYKEKAIKEGIPYDESKVPKASKHLYGQAVDIFDPDKKLQEWCLLHEKELLEIGLWLESFTATPNWCHFQIIPYSSWRIGKSIWFNP